MDVISTGVAWTIPLGSIGFFVWLTVSAVYRHGERMEEKKIKAREAERSIKK